MGIHLNEKFSNEIKTIENIKMFKPHKLTKLSEFLSDNLISDLLKVNKYSYKHKFNRRTVTKDFLVNSNLRLALISSNKFFETTGAHRKNKVCYDDVVSESIMGLIKASENFIKSADGGYSNHSFVNYATPWVNKYSREYIANTNPVKICVNEVKADVLAGVRFESTSNIGLGSDDGFINTPTALQSHQDSSVDTKIELDRRAYLINKLTECLTTKQLFIINTIYGLDGSVPKTTKQLAKMYNTMKQRLEKTHQSALNSMRDCGISQADMLELYTLSKNITISKAEYEFNTTSVNNLTVIDDDTEIEIQRNTTANIEMCKSINKYIENTIIVDGLRGSKYTSLKVFELKLNTGIQRTNYEPIGHGYRQVTI